MNIIVWNCRGALKPSFQKHVRELVQNHDPAILVVMETKVGRDRAREITGKLPFDGAIHTDTIGYAGGLWVLWNVDKVEISSLANTEQEIHIVVKVRSLNSSWLFTAVYASPRSVERQILWNNLMRVAKLQNMSWVIVRDFNEPLVEEDKFGGRAISVDRSLLFKECLEKSNMIDIGFSSLWFTWSNRREVQVLIQERIDRFFVNPSWCILFPEARWFISQDAIQTSTSFCWRCSQGLQIEEKGRLSFNPIGFLMFPFQRLFLKLGGIIPGL